MKILTSIMMMALSFSAIAKPKADIAFIIDTSGSMQGLINQVRDGVWSTLNNLGEIKKNGDIAELRLALYEYGSGVVSSEANFIQLLVPLTTDHMSVAEKLFATKAIGSQEYSGMAIKLATENLDFSKSINDFKSIILAGNETIHQGPVDPLLASSEALDKDILINTIYAGSQTRTVFNSGGTGGFGCGFRICQPTPTPIPSDPQTELNPEFAEFMELAKVGGGMTLNIDQNNSIPFVSSPYDEKIIFTTEAITETYLPFG